MNIRPTLTHLAPAIHGARNYQELAHLSLNSNDVIDFSSNNNPYGPHPTVLEAVSAAVTASTLAHYPDRDCLALREVIALAEGVPTNYILPTNGASELIQLIALAFVVPNSCHLIVPPTFGEYGRAIHLMGGLTHEYHLHAPNFLFNPKNIATTIYNLQLDGVWLCAPNNPTGQVWTPEEINQLRAADPDHQIMWVIDESYRYFGQHPPLFNPAYKREISNTFSSYGRRLEREQNTIIVRSLTKEHNLAGIRLGYAIANPKVIEALQTVQPSWSVNSLAQIAGVAALQPDVLVWRDQSLAQLQQDAAMLWQELSATGLTVLPSSTSYALIKVGNAEAFRHALLTQGLLVRNCTSFGLPEYIRVAAQLPEENKKLVIAVKNLVEE